MAENTGIQWTDHTFNPWSGCTKVSPGCTNCYAANAMPSARRYSIWGDNGTRVPASPSYWKFPEKWNRQAAASGVRARVFCSSMADVFEDREGLEVWRSRLFVLIRDTPWLDWQLLTKRPEAAYRFWKNMSEPQGDGLFPWKWPENAWIGTSVENQEAADTRIPWILKIPAPVRFLSCEPLLGAVNIARWLSVRPCACEAKGDVNPFRACSETPCAARIGWVIAGGESGPRARPMHPDWARALRDQCAAAKVPFFFKQYGEWRTYSASDFHHRPDWMHREYELQEADVSQHRWDDAGIAYRIGKPEAGRMLDGREWNEFPHTEGMVGVSNG